MKSNNNNYSLNYIVSLLIICLICIIYILYNKKDIIKDNELIIDINNRILKQYPNANGFEVLNSKNIHDNKILLYKFKVKNYIYWGYIVYKIDTPKTFVYDKLYINNFKDDIRFNIKTPNNSYMILCNIKGNIIIKKNIDL